MKIFGLIVAIILWLLTAFGCEPVNPTPQAQPTQEVTQQATESPEAASPQSTKKPKATKKPKPTKKPGKPDNEDTLLPEI